MAKCENPRVYLDLAEQREGKAKAKRKGSSTSSSHSFTQTF